MLGKYLGEEHSLQNNPANFYPFLKIIKNVQDHDLARLKEIRENVKIQLELLQNQSEIIESAANDFMQQSKMSTNLKARPHDSLEKIDNLVESYDEENLNFIVLMSQIFNVITRIYDDFYETLRKLNPPNVLLSEDSTISFQNTLAEMQLNGPLIQSYINNLNKIYNHTEIPNDLGDAIYHSMEVYYKMLLKRHTADGIKIYKDPIITDVAVRIFKNIDSHGEIESGRNDDQVSAYTLHKAEVLTRVLKDPIVHGFISNPQTLVAFISESIIQLKGFYDETVDALHNQFEDLCRMCFAPMPKKCSTVKGTIMQFTNVNPADISYVEPKKIISETDNLTRKIEDETYNKVVEMLLDQSVNFKDIVKYILARKTELRKFFHEENSFYVCKIGDGNPFLGQAPGALFVTPAERPKGDMKWILGSGFNEVRKFAESITSSAKYHSLFLATSPSKSADKSNVLLIGPPGCGKTEVMRAVGSDKGSIGVFAQGSDFLTCWKGEAEKNPKRMFEEGLKLNNESGKHVHFLIDEIDSVLNNDKSISGTTNLTLEFQIMMDGVVAYPNLSVWGATNFPERIPMAMLRRFSKVLIVGELNQEERIKLLKHFLGHMPIDKIEQIEWETWANQLDGATGDVLRKVADYLWREKMNSFVTAKPQKAEELAKLLEVDGKKFSFDNFDREAFKKALKPYVRIRKEDIDKAVDDCLHNVSIIHEIETAVSTYTKAKELMYKINE